MLAWLLTGLAALAVVVTALRVRRQGWRGSWGFAAAMLPLAALVVLTAHAGRWASAKPRKAKEPPDFCFSARAYAPLAALPRGVTIGEIDLGPFVLAHTPSSAMSAPYHRMSRGILAARAVLTTPADAAQARALALSPGGKFGPVYVLECRRHADHVDRSGLRPDSLQARLDAAKPPAWLERMSAPGAPIEVYRARPLRP